MRLLPPRSNRVLIPVIALSLLFVISGCTSDEFAVPVTPDDNRASVHERTFDAIWETIDENYIYIDALQTEREAVRAAYQPQISDNLTPAEFEAIMSDMLASLHADITYLSREDRIELAIDTAAKYGGIGIFVSFRAEPVPRILLLSVMAGSPAERAGLRAHESIIAIDGEPILVEEGLDSVARVRGPAGTKVTLTVQSPDGASRDVAVTRDQIETTVQPIMADYAFEEGIGYLLLPPVAYEQQFEDIVIAVQQIESQEGFSGLVLDLRIASGRGEFPLAELFTLFTDGQLGEFYARDTVEPVDIQGQDFEGSQEFPLALIIGPDTDSEVEVMAAALQANGRALVVGLPSGGQIESFESFALPDGSSIAMPINSFRTVDGDEPGISGVEPDVTVALEWDEVTVEDDPVIDAAIQALVESQ